MLELFILLSTGIITFTIGLATGYWLRGRFDRDNSNVTLPRGYKIIDDNDKWGGEK